MGISAFFAVGCGAALGAWLRWGLGALLNSLFPTLPPGTVAANLIGGLLMGVALGAGLHFQDLSPSWRLFTITGFLGGLTTFSTFTGEAVSLLLRQQYLWFASHMAIHVLGSIGATALGFVLIRVWLRT